ncbi:F-box/LRR-repeat protein 14 [Arachis hypogaea]|uniref:F-box/LRR-repeat protein 14 n=1 Tax=Arachis hypogaea TaxID=3818 RepID=UPI000DECEE3F|nr:F-box/LRR-repeat protein 2 isoform X2 [Arachis hypogaea]
MSMSSSSSSSDSESEYSNLQHIPDECWESVFKYLSDPLDHESLSLVSSHFLSLTNRLRTSLTVSDHVLPFLPALLCRFPNLTSINLTHHTGDLNELLSQIASSHLPSLRSLDLSHQPALPSIALRHFSRKFPALKSLNCSFMDSLTDKDLNLIAECFPNLEEIDISYPRIADAESRVKALASGFKKLRKVNLSGLPLRKLSLPGCFQYGYGGISSLLRNCNNLQHLDLQCTEFLDDRCVIELSMLLGNLNFVNLSENSNLSDSSLFAIIRNCPLITEIRMERAGVGKQKVEKDCLVVNSHLKFLYLTRNSYLDDESVEMIASVCPNLETMDLSYCERVSEGAVEVLRKCCKIRHMNLARLGSELFRIDFEIPTLCSLNLSWLRIGDEELSLISKRCHRLKELKLDFCQKITANGVNQVVENCKQLRVISLFSCEKVAADVVAWMVFTRRSLRKIIAPPRFHLTEGQRDLFLRHGCIVSSDLTNVTDSSARNYEPELLEAFLFP